MGRTSKNREEKFLYKERAHRKDKQIETAKQVFEMKRCLYMVKRKFQRNDGGITMAHFG